MDSEEEQFYQFTKFSTFQVNENGYTNIEERNSKFHTCRPLRGD